MASEQARVVALLDELQAAERAGAAALEQWIRSCREPALRGGLRVVAARDAAHATLAEVVRSIEDDGETRALLETIGDDERASLRWLREVGEGLPQVDDDGGAERETVIPLLDALRAAEAAAEEVFGAWIAVCASPGLRGGLRTIAAREGTHARLLAERLRELGAAPTRTLSAGLRRAALGYVGASGVSDV